MGFSHHHRLWRFPKSGVSPFIIRWWDFPCKPSSLQETISWNVLNHQRPYLISPGEQSFATGCGVWIPHTPNFDIYEPWKKGVEDSCLIGFGRSFSGLHLKSQERKRIIHRFTCPEFSSCLQYISAKLFNSIIWGWPMAWLENCVCVSDPSFEGGTASLHSGISLQELTCFGWNTANTSHSTTTFYINCIS